MKIRQILGVLIILANSIPELAFARDTINRVNTVSLGVSQANITPGTPTLMSGYGARKTPFTGVHDSLYASAFYFFGEKVKTLLITADLIGFSFGFVDEVKSMISSKIGIPPENIMVVAVHNHGGPSINDNGTETVREYTRYLKKKLTNLAVEASKNAAPFRMGVGKGYCNMNINRRAEFAKGEVWLGRNPDGPCSHELGVVKFESMGNKPLAILINWPCHGTATGESNYQITGDWPGSAARYIKKQMGEGVVVAVTAGASADINPIYGPGNDFREVEAIGYHVGAETSNVLAQIETFPVKTIQAMDTTLSFPGKKRSQGHFPQASYESGPDTEIRLSAFKIGSLVLAGISGELMTEIGMGIKKQSPYSGTIILTHCNGSSGYICTDKSYPEGGYEIKVTKLMPGVEKPLIRGFVGLIRSFE